MVASVGVGEVRGGLAPLAEGGAVVGHNSGELAVGMGSLEVASWC